MSNSLKTIYADNIKHISKLLLFGSKNHQIQDSYIKIKYNSLISEFNEIIIPLQNHELFMDENQGLLTSLLKQISKDISNQTEQVIVIIPDQLTETTIIKENLPKKINMLGYDTLRLSILNLKHIAKHYKKKLYQVINQDENIYPLKSRRYNKSKDYQLINDTKNNLINEIKIEICLENHSKYFTSIIGSYGSGKSVLLHEVANNLISEENLVLPILLDLNSLSNIETKINQFINEIYKIYINDSFSNFYSCFKDQINFVFLLDSFDEQRTINDDVIDSFLKSLSNFIQKYDAKVILASRPEIFSNWKNSLLVSKKIIVKEKTAYYLESINNDNKVIDEILNNISSSYSAVISDYIKEFIEKPIWYKYSLSFFKENHNEITGDWLTRLVEYCIANWQKRENKTERHPLLSSMRNQLNLIASLWIFTTNYKIKRSKFIDFIRELVRDTNIIRESKLGVANLSDYLPPEATAQSLIVSNLITIDEENYISFNEGNLFYLYFLSKIIKDIFLGKSIREIKPEILSKYFDIANNNYILGSHLLPDSELFFQLMSDSLRRIDITKFSNLFLDNFKIDTVDKPRYNNLGEILLDYQPNVVEEKRIYELKPPGYWPQNSNTYHIHNLFNILKRTNNGVINNLNLNYCIIKNYDCQNITFENCSFIGTHFVYCNIKKTNFTNCILKYTLFEHCEIDNNSYQSITKYKEYYFLDNQKSNQEKLSNFLSTIKKDDEEWILSDDIIKVVENGRTPVKVPLFLTKKNPPSNSEIISFIETNNKYEIINFKGEIENRYYLQYIRSYRDMDRKDARQSHFLEKPITYISLVTAYAYCLFKEARLPSVAEVILIKNRPNSEIETMILKDYWSLPNIIKNDFYPNNFLVEMTYQIDNLDYWRDIRNNKKQKSFHVAPMPNFDRTQKMRCEYLIYGDESFYGVEKNKKFKTSKLATWLNPDQTFRCIYDYTSIIFQRVKS